MSKDKRVTANCSKLFKLDGTIGGGLRRECSSFFLQFGKFSNQFLVIKLIWKKHRFSRKTAFYDNAHFSSKLEDIKKKTFTSESASKMGSIFLEWGLDYYPRGEHLHFSDF